MKVRLEDVLCSRNGFGLRTASNLQRAICRASDGEPLKELWDDANVRTAFGGTRPPVGTAPDTLVILSAIRCGKSMIAAAKAIQISQNVDVSMPYLSAGDELRIPIVSIDLDKARAVFSHMVGQIQAKPMLKALMVGDPKDDSFWLRHPSGRLIEVCTTPLAKSGSTLVARWLPAVIFDEAPLMAGVQDAKKNLTEALGAINGRVLPGGQVMMIGSPWAPFGPVFDLVQENWGKPTTECVVVRAPGPVMNPVRWTPAACEKVRLKNPVSYITNVLAEFADMEDGIFSTVEIQAATREAPVARPFVKGHHYTASMDPAFRGNAWTLVILGCVGLGGPGGISPMYSVVLCRQWIGSKVQPLKGQQVMAEIAEICREYGIDTVTSDQHNVDTLSEFADMYGLSINEVVTRSEDKLERVERVNALISDGRFELPPDRQLGSDLKSARKRVTQNGATLVLPRSGDGRHADYVPALGLACIAPPEAPDPPEPEKPDHMELHLARMREANSGGFWENISRVISR